MLRVSGAGLRLAGGGGRGGARAELHFARRTEIDGISAYGNNDPRGHKKIRLSRRIVKSIWLISIKKHFARTYVIAVVARLGPPYY